MITIDVSNCEVARVLIDGGSSVDLIFKDTLARMGISEDEIEREQTQLTGFNGSTTPSLGIIKLQVKTNGINKIVEFHVLDCLSPYNIILGRPWIHRMRAVPSTFHQCIRFPTPEGIKEIRGNQVTSPSCYLTSYRHYVKATKKEQ